MINRTLVLIAFVAAIAWAGAASAQDLTTQDLTTEETQSLRDRVRECWTLPVGASQSDIPPIHIEVRLNADGSLEGPPVLVTGLAATGPLATRVLESAMRAIYDCAPFGLPAGKHASWKRIRIAFDARAPATCLSCMSCHVHERPGCNSSRGMVQLSFQKTVGF